MRISFLSFEQISQLGCRYVQTSRISLNIISPDQYIGHRLDIIFTQIEQTLIRASLIPLPYNIGSTA